MVKLQNKQHHLNPEDFKVLGVFQLQENNSKVDNKQEVLYNTAYDEKTEKFKSTKKGKEVDSKSKSCYNQI